MKVTQQNHPFTHWVIEWFAIDIETVTKAYYDVTTPGAILVPWVNYANPDEKKQTCNDFAEIGPDAEALADRLVMPWTVGLVEGIVRVNGLDADPTWHGGGYHVSGAGGYLGPHIDYALHPTTGQERRVNLVWFLTPNWQESWGGRLQFWNDTVTEVEAEVLPAFNRAVIWCPGDTTYHSVEQVSAAAQRPRVSLACYYTSAPRTSAVRKRALFVPQRGG